MLRYIRWIVLIFVLFSLPCCPWPVSAHPEVHEWLRGLHNGTGMSCCGDNDCIPVASVVVLNAPSPDTRTILINESVRVEIPRTNLVEVSCVQQSRPHVCLQRFVQQDDDQKPCTRTDPDGTVHMMSFPGCFRCVVIPYYCSS